MLRAVAYVLLGVGAILVLLGVVVSTLSERRVSHGLMRGIGSLGLGSLVLLNMNADAWLAPSIQVPAMVAVALVSITLLALGGQRRG